MSVNWLSMIPMSLLSVFFIGDVARSAMVLRVDMDLLAPDFQTAIVRSPGATVTAGIFAELTGNTSISIYNFSVQYDRNELSFVSRTETPSLLTGLAELDLSNPNDVAAGLLRRFDGTTFGAGPVAPFGPVKIAEVSFNVLTPTGGSNDIDVLPGIFETTPVLFDQFFNNAGDDISTQVTFFGGSVSVAIIPEPATSSLVLAVGLLALGRRRRA